MSKKNLKKGFVFSSKISKSPFSKFNHKCIVFPIFLLFLYFQQNEIKRGGFGGGVWAQCDGSGNDAWIFSHAPSAQITYSHLWVDPTQFNVFIGGHSTSPTSLHSQVPTGSTRAALIEYYEQSDTLGSPTSAHLISQVGLNGVPNQVSAIHALNGIPSGQQQQPMSVVVLELATNPSLVFGKWLPVKNILSLYTVQLSDVTNWGCSFASPMLSNFETAYTYYAFESCDILDTKQYVASFKATTTPPTYSFASLDSSGFVGISRKIVGIHTDPTLNSRAIFMFYSINNGSYYLIFESHNSAQIGQFYQCVYLALNFNVNVNGGVAQGIHLWKPVAYHVYLNSVLNHENVFIIMEKIDKNSELVFIKNDFSKRFMSAVSHQFEIGAMGGAFCSTLTQMVLLSSFAASQSVTVLFKDLGTTKMYLIANLDLEFYTIGSFLEVIGSTFGTSPLLSTGWSPLFDSPNMVHSAVNGSTIVIHQLAADRAVRSVDPTTSACYRYTMQTPTNFASPTWDTALIFIGSATPAYTLFAQDLNQPVVVLDTLIQPKTQEFVITTTLQQGFRLYNPCMLRSQTPFTNQLYELQLGLREFTYTLAEHSWVDTCQNGQSLNPLTPRIWLSKTVDQFNNEINAPISYLDVKVDNLGTLELDTSNLNLSAGQFTVHYKASYQDSISIDEAYYSGTFTLVIAQQSTCSSSVFNVPSVTTFDYGVVPQTPTPTQFHLDLPYDNSGCHFSLKPVQAVNPVWFALTDQVLAQQFDGSVWRWATSQAAFFTITSSDLTLVGTQVRIGLQMVSTFYGDSQLFDIFFNFKQKCVPNLSLDPFQSQIIQFGTTQTLDISSKASNGNCQYNVLLSNADSTAYDAGVFSESAAQFQLQANSVDIYTITAQHQLKVATTNTSSDLSKLGIYNLLIRLQDADQSVVEVQQKIQITIEERCITDAVITNFSQTALTYQIDSFVLNVQNIAMPVTNSDCGFSTSLLFTQSGSQVPQPPTQATFLFKTAQLSAQTAIPFQIGYFTIDSNASLQIGTTDVSQIGTYYFTLTIHSQQDALDSRTYDFAFTVTIEYECVENLIVPSFEEYIYQIDTVNPNLSTYTLIGSIWNGNCDFQVQLSSVVRTDNVPIASSPLSGQGSLFSFTPPSLQHIAGSSSNAVTQTSAASIQIQTSDATNQAEYILTFSVASNAFVNGSQSTATQAFKQKFNLQEICVNGLLIMPTVPSLIPTPVYTIGSPDALTITFPAMSNGNCLFTASLAQQNASSVGSSLPGIGFTYTPHLQTQKAGSSNVMETTRTASVSVFTSDLTLATQPGQLSLLLTAVDPINSGLLTKSVTILVDVKFQCVSGGISMPDKFAPIRYRVMEEVVGSMTPPTPTSESFSLGPISNSLCTFSTSLQDANGNQLTLNNGQFQFDDVILTPQASLTVANQVTVAQEATLHIVSNDLANLGFYDATLVATNADGSLSEQRAVSIEMYSNLCVGGSLSSMPSSVDLTRQIKLSNLSVNSQMITIIELGPISNGECKFGTEIAMANGEQINTEIFGVVQPMFTQNVASNDPQILDVLSDGNIRVGPLNISHLGTYNLILTVKSMREPYDTVQESIQFQITISPCQTADLDLPLLSFGLQTDLIYTQYEPTLTILIEQKIACAQTKLVIFNDLATNSLDQELFLTVENQVLRNVDLQIQTDSVSKVGQYFLTIREENSTSGQVYIEETINISVKDFCESAQLQASQINDFSHVSGFQPQKVTWDEFQLSLEHSPKCLPIIYTISMHQVQGQAQENWFSLSAQKREIVINLPEIAEDVVVKFIILGQIQGISQYASATTEFKVSIKGVQISAKKEEEIQENSSESQKTNQEVESKQKQEQQLESVYSFTFEPKVQTRKYVEIKPLPPTGTITKISNTGQVMVNFDKALFVQDYFKNIEQKKQAQNQIDLSQDMITLEVISSNDYISDENPNAFAIKSIRMISFSSKQIEFQLEFENPRLISKDKGNLDDLLLTFNGKIPLIDIQDGLKIKTGQKTINSIPQQLTQAEVQELQEFGESVAQSTTILASSNLVVNIALSQTLKFVWGLVNLLQIAILLPEWLIGFPEQSEILFGYLKSLAFLEFFDAKESLNAFFAQVGQTIEMRVSTENETDFDGQKEQDAERETRLLKTTVLKSTNVTPNESAILREQEQPDLVGKGAIMIILALVLAIVLLFLLCLKPIIYCDYQIYKAYRLLQQRIFYNAFIRYVLQSSLKLEMAAASSIFLIQTALQETQFDNLKEQSQNSFQEILSWIILGGSLLLPIFFGFVMYKNHENLAYPSTKKKIGSIYGGCKTDQKPALLYSIIFLYRRIIFVGITFLMRPYPSLQIASLVWLNCAYLGYLLHVSPLDSMVQQNLEIYNESMFAVVCLFLFWLQDPFAERGTRKIMGKSINYMVFAMIFVTFAIVLGQIMHKAFSTCKQKCHKSAYQKKLLEKEKQKTKLQIEKEEKWVQEQNLPIYLENPNILLTTTRQPIKECSHSIISEHDNSQNQREEKNQLFDNFRFSVARHNLLQLQRQEKEESPKENQQAIELLNPPSDSYLTRMLEDRPNSFKSVQFEGPKIKDLSEIDKIGATEPQVLPRFVFNTSLTPKLYAYCENQETAQEFITEEKSSDIPANFFTPLPSKLEAKFVSYKNTANKNRYPSNLLLAKNQSSKGISCEEFKENSREKNIMFDDNFQSVIMKKIHRKI